MNFFLFQMLGVVSEVILNECSDEVVAVIVTFMHTQVEWVFSSFACLDEVFRLELSFKEGVTCALIDKQFKFFSGLTDKLAGIPLFPLFFIVAKIGAKSFLSPWDLARGDDGGEGRHALEHARVFERDHQGTVTTHGVSKDGALGCGVEGVFNEFGQFLRDVVVHLVVLGPGLLSGVDVKASALAEVIRIIVGDIVTTRARIWRDNDQAKLTGDTLCARLGGEVLFGAGETTKPVDHRAGFCTRLGWQINRHSHGTVERLGGVLPDLLFATKACVLIYFLHDSSP